MNTSFRFGWSVVFFLCCSTLTVQGQNISCPYAQERYAANQTEDVRSITRHLRNLLDERALATRLQHIQSLKEAGFIFQPQLTVNEEVCTAPHEIDTSAVLSGMITADRGFAFFFGTAEEASRANTLLEQLIKKPSPPLRAEERRILSKSTSKTAIQYLLQRRAHELEQLLAYADTPEHLSHVGAHLYGVFLEHMFLSSVMTLAAAETDSLEPLRGMHADIEQHLGNALQYLGQRGFLADSKEQSTMRTTVVQQVLSLLGQGQPSLEQLKTIVALIQTERGQFFSPCAVPARATRMQ